MRKPFFLIILSGFVILIVGCVRSAPESPEWKPGAPEINPTDNEFITKTPTPSFHLLPTRIPGSPELTPTPDTPRVISTQLTNPDQYTVQSGDSLGIIARQFSISIDSLMKANNLSDPNILYIGQILVIPQPSLQDTGTAFKIIPDSELVFGPMSITFDNINFIHNFGGYLSNYHEDIDDSYLDAGQIINLVSENYSVNPRLLLALLEYRSGWLTKTLPTSNTLDYPIGFNDNWHIGLYRQLTWAANILNRGYYLWKVNALAGVLLTDGVFVPLDPTINSGTAAVQYLFSNLDDYVDWQEDVSPDGFYSVYKNLFGYPFDFAIEPLVPSDLIQPDMILPFEKNLIWSFTGGPHGGWDSGSAWAALDFAPPGETQGCVMSNAWVTAVADGLIVRAKNGAVIQDLDGDGFEQTGWVILYMHIDRIDRVTEGMFLHAGDRIGHPSCEGGVSNGTHVHLARKFNGEWISADGSVPFNLDGWVSSGTGYEYDGYLKRNDQVVEAFDGIIPENQIKR
ncbi:MAG: LysM peptidoglycan-binding domain-containing protein [Chloroflexota bacterium]